MRVHYAKSGRMRFTSHRDFARALERALRRADVPIAFSAGFSPHPKISYIGAAPTGVSSDAEYLELGLSRSLDLDDLRVRLDHALPDGLDIVEVVAAGPGSMAERVEASAWRIGLAVAGPGGSLDVRSAGDGSAGGGSAGGSAGSAGGVAGGIAGIDRAAAAFMESTSVLVQRLTKDGRRELDARTAVISMTVSADPDDASRAILDLVVRQATPSVRPDDVLAALIVLGAELPSEPPRAVRLAQGPLQPDGTVGDPLAVDRDAAAPAS